MNSDYLSLTEGTSSPLLHPFSNETQGDAVVIREVSFADAPRLLEAIEAINNEAGVLPQADEQKLSAATSKEYFEGLLEKERGTYFVAVRNEEIVGYVGILFGRFQRTRGAMLIPYLGVRQAFRRRGVGERLLAACQSWCLEKEGHRIELSVPESNVPALKLLQKLGFVVEGRIPNASFQNGSWCSDIWMARVLMEFPEPHWEPLETNPAADQVALDVVDFRVPGPKHAREMWTWEYGLLTGSLVHFKLPHELAAVPRLAKQLQRAARAPGQFSLAAFLDRGTSQELVGYIRAGRAFGARDRNVLFRLNVSPDYTGSGIGRRLVEEMERWARGLGIQRLSTSIPAHNSRALRFADRLGFAPEVTARNYAVIDGQVCDRVLLGKVLA